MIHKEQTGRKEMSNLIKCVNGHYYDADKNKSCPYCSAGAQKKKDVVMQGDMSADLDDVKTVALNIGGGRTGRRSIKIPHVSGQTVKPPADLWKKEQQENITHNIREVFTESEEEKTVALNAFLTGVEPVTGWLVCMSGKDRGTDFRLIRGRNKVGRDILMDVSIRHDMTVSRQEHCSIVYDERSNMSFLVPGNGTLTYYKGEMLRQAQQLKSGDEIEIGETKFIFISFCEGERVWKEEE